MVAPRRYPAPEGAPHMRTCMRVARGAFGTLSLQVTCTAEALSFPDNEPKGEWAMAWVL